MNNLLRKKTNELSKKKKKGFTLVELIIVIAIIAILAAIAIPRFGEIRENANVKADIANAKNIETSVLTGIANDDITITAATGVVDLSSVIDGTIPTGKASAHKGVAFVATVSNNVVHVTLGADEVLPTPTGAYS